MTDDLTHRIEGLEARVAHQDRTIEELNATITAQWRKIDELVRDAAIIADRLNDLGRRDSLAPEPPPPHY